MVETGAGFLSPRKLGNKEVVRESLDLEKGWFELKAHSDARGNQGRVLASPNSRKVIVDPRWKQG